MTVQTLKKLLRRMESLNVTIEKKPVLQLPLKLPSDSAVATHEHVENLI